MVKFRICVILDKFVKLLLLPQEVHRGGLAPSCHCSILIEIPKVKWENVLSNVFDKLGFYAYKDIQLNDTQHNDTHHNDR